MPAFEEPGMLKVSFSAFPLRPPPPPILSPLPLSQRQGHYELPYSTYCNSISCTLCGGLHQSILMLLYSVGRTQAAVAQTCHAPNQHCATSSSARQGVCTAKQHSGSLLGLSPTSSSYEAPTAYNLTRALNLLSE